MVSKPKSVVRSRSEGQALWLLGSLFDIKATGDDTGGALTVVELTVGPKLLAAPPHRHNGHEAAYVIEGNLKYHVDGREQDVSAGAFLFFPQGTLEWFENTSDRPARVLIVYAPAGIEKFFREVAQPAKSRTLPPPPSGPPDFAKLVAVAKKYGLEIQPPPPAH